MWIDFNQTLLKYNIKPKGLIHIGAHYGTEYNIYKQSNIENCIFFEPLIKNFKVLKEHVGDKVQCYNLALGNKICDIEMYVENSNQSRSCSVLRPKHHLNQYPSIHFNEREMVKMNRLDDIDFVKSNYNIIVIDVQGYELEVFKGASKFLNNVDLIISEINIEEMYENCVLVNDLNNYLLTYNFELVEKHCPHNTWGDGIYIKKQ